eukprot:symbB.v1.2.009978.t1/scaffold623.1/size335370/21
MEMRRNRTMRDGGLTSPRSYSPRTSECRASDCTQTDDFDQAVILKREESTDPKDVRVDVGTSELVASEVQQVRISAPAVFKLAL